MPNNPDEPSYEDHETVTGGPGTPGWPNPGQQNPYNQPQNPYGPPGQNPYGQQPPYGTPGPYGQQPPYGAYPGDTAPLYGAGQPPYGGPPPFDTGGGGGGGGPGNNAMLIIIAAVAVLVILIGVGFFLVLKSNGTPQAGPSASPSSSAPASAPASSAPVSTEPSTSASGTPLLFNPQPGDCVQNTGSFSSPFLTVVSCDGGDADYRVLKRIDNTIDRHQCDGVQGANYEVDIPSQDFVLCLQSV